NLQTDYIDLLLIHRPDPLMNADEVAETFYKLKKEGKVLNFGVSNFTIQQFSLLQSRLDFPLITNQIEFSPYNVSAQHTGLLEFLQEKRVKPTIWSPFAGGRVFHGEDEMIRRVRDVLNKLKGKYEAEIDQLLLAWYLKHPVGMLPILGSGKRERIESAIKALSINLEREDWFRIWEAINGVEVP
ncbi:MAG: oxidoreductase, partial [Methanobacteriota archaeon]